jgi:hypothetical protein
MFRTVAVRPSGFPVSLRRGSRPRAKSGVSGKWPSGFSSERKVPIRVVGEQPAEAARFGIGDSPQGEPLKTRQPPRRERRTLGSVASSKVIGAYPLSGQEFSDSRGVRSVVLRPSLRVRAGHSWRLWSPKTPVRSTGRPRPLCCLRQTRRFAVRGQAVVSFSEALLAEKLLYRNVRPRRVARQHLLSELCARLRSPKAAFH